MLQFGLKSVNNIDIFVKKIDNYNLQHVHSCKYLGVIVDEQLNWREHIDHVYSKLIIFTSLFYKNIRDMLSWDRLNMLYFTFVDSNLLYGIEIYDNSCGTYFSELTTLNNKILRILQNKPYDTRTTDLYRTYCTLPVLKLHEFRVLLLIKGKN